MATYTTEIASDKILSDNPIHQRLLQAYYLAKPYVKGDLLELGCGEGRGVELGAFSNFLCCLGQDWRSDRAQRKTSIS